MSDTFSFKQFTIKQDQCAMKVGTDGVLIGAWAHGGSRILDIGSGTGLIALLMAQRFPLAHVEGVEIDTEASIQAKENVMSSPFANRIKIYNKALQGFTPSTEYDSIVSNPPFYAHHMKSPYSKRTLAREADKLPFGAVLDFARKWLSQDGELSVILPTESADEFCEGAFMRGLFLSRLWKISTVNRKPPKRSLVALSKTRHKTFDEGYATLLEPNGDKSLWYKELTSDFYLK